MKLMQRYGNTLMMKILNIIKVLERYKDYCIANDINQAAIISTTGEAVGNILTDRDIPLNAKSILDCTDDADVKKHDQEITLVFKNLVQVQRKWLM